MKKEVKITLDAEYLKKLEKLVNIKIKNATEAEVAIRILINRFSE